MKYYLLSVLLSYGQLLFAQFNDVNWIFGENTKPGTGDPFGIAHLSFKEGNVTIEELQWIGAMSRNNSTYSDSLGNFELLFNGFRLTDRSFNTMQWGDSIGYSTNPNILQFSGYFPQGSLFLQWPGHPDSLLMLYNSQVYYYIPGNSILTSKHLTYSLIRRSNNKGLGAVQVRRGLILDDTIQYGRLTAVKHANGRDWWLPINERNSNRFYMYLLDPTGVRLIKQQAIGIPVIDGVGFAAFSPNGEHYAMMNCITDTDNFLYIFDFDRCTGTFSSQRHYQYNGKGFGGVAFSPNSRFLYMGFTFDLFQYDLKQKNPDSTKIKIAGYKVAPPGDRASSFMNLQLAPDGKIYISNYNQLRYLHVIHQPDEYGLGCAFEHYSLQLPVYTSSLTANPNPRLGPIDGSSCDTLGLNNLPQAWFGYEQDTLDPLRVSFRDLSFYEPESWEWYLGSSGQNSTERHPEYTFPAPGKYKVCLKVSNTNGTHTHCKTLYLGITAQDNPVLQAQVQVMPNPFTSRLSVALSASHLRSPVFRLYDVTGRLVLSERLEYGINEMNTEALEKGMYFWVVEHEAGASRERVKQGKIVKL